VSSANQSENKKHDPKRERIARRAALEFKNGNYANLGVGIPMFVANFIPKDVKIQLHAENGVLGLVTFELNV
jgi:3-oxoacid CoA-transferase